MAITAPWARRKQRLERRMAKLKARFIAVGRKGGKPARLKAKLVKIKARMMKVGIRMKKLVVRAKQARIKADVRASRPVKITKAPRVKKVKAPKVPKEKKGRKTKLAKIESLAELRTRAKIDPAYAQLAITAASTLGKNTSNVNDAIQWLSTNANETTEEGVVAEVNGVRDIVAAIMDGKSNETPTVTFTDDELKEIARAANRTFEYIAGDFFSLIQESENRDYARQSEVIEMVVDANRMSSHGGLSRELEERLYAMKFEDQQKLMRKIFPAKKYS